MTSETVKEAWNMVCPECGCDDEIDIAATLWVRLCPDGTDVNAAANGDHEWGDHDPAECMACGFQGAAADFKGMTARQEPAKAAPQLLAALKALHRQATFSDIAFSPANVHAAHVIAEAEKGA